MIAAVSFLCSTVIGCVTAALFVGAIVYALIVAGCWLDAQGRVNRYTGPRGQFRDAHGYIKENT